MKIQPLSQHSIFDVLSWKKCHDEEQIKQAADEKNNLSDGAYGYNAFSKPNL